MRFRKVRNYVLIGSLILLVGTFLTTISLEAGFFTRFYAPGQHSPVFYWIVSIVDGSDYSNLLKTANKICLNLAEIGTEPTRIQISKANMAIDDAGTYISASNTPIEAQPWWKNDWKEVCQIHYIYSPGEL